MHSLAWSDNKLPASDWLFSRQNTVQNNADGHVHNLPLTSLDNAFYTPRTVLWATTGINKCNKTFQCFDFSTTSNVINIKSQRHKSTNTPQHLLKKITWQNCLLCQILMQFF